MKTKLTDFDFIFAGYGFYKVIYTSPATRKQWTVKISDMPLIDATKNAENPKLKDLNLLKFICKS